MNKLELKKTVDEITNIVDDYNNMDSVDDWDEMDKRLSDAISALFSSRLSTLEKRVEEMKMGQAAFKEDSPDIDPRFIDGTIVALKDVLEIIREMREGE